MMIKTQMRRYEKNKSKSIFARENFRFMIPATQADAIS